jgi:hypothetical protein
MYSAVFRGGPLDGDIQPMEERLLEIRTPDLPLELPKIYTREDLTEVKIELTHRYTLVHQAHNVLLYEYRGHA